MCLLDMLSRRRWWWTGRAQGFSSTYQFSFVSECMDGSSGVGLVKISMLFLLRLHWGSLVRLCVIGVQWNYFVEGLLGSEVHTIDLVVFWGIEMLCLWWWWLWLLLLFQFQVHFPSFIFLNGLVWSNGIWLLEFTGVVGSSKGYVWISPAVVRVFVGL